MTDGLGLPIRFSAGPGQENDMKRACGLIDGLAAKYVLADRAYDADTLMDVIYEIGAEPVIPPRRHRRVKHPYDRELYKERNQIERLFAKLKEFRRVATRYDKLLRNFIGFVMIAAIHLWLK